jgi:hypothetical protein
MLKLARYGLGFVASAVVFSGCSCDETETETNEGGANTVASTAVGTTTASTTGSGGEGGTGGGFVCDPGVGTTLALTELRFGTDVAGGWKKIGRNIDGLASTGMSTDVCQPNANGDPNFAYPDGDNGIDNSFGKSLLPLILFYSPEYPARVNQYLDEGTFNAMLKAYCLPPTGNARMVSKVFGGTPLGYPPAYDGTDEWPVAPELLSDLSDPESSTLVFENSTVIDNVFDSAPGEEFVLSIPLEFMDQTQTLKLSLHAAQLTLTLAEDRKSATGILSGVLNTEEAIEQVDKIAWMAGLCDAKEYDSAVTLIRQMSDIMTDGTQDPNATCDGISFGVELDMREIQLGLIGPVAPPAMSCP